MINYIEKGAGLHQELKENGFSVWHENRQVKFSPEDKGVEIQALIDSYDPVPYEREQAKQRLIVEFDEQTAYLEDQYPEVEKRTFDKQETEARGYTNDPTHPIPTINAIASARGVEVQVIVDRIIEKADQYTAAVGALVGLRQHKEDLIDAATDWREIQNIKLIG